jgi:uroporphyrinogen decarboxylase
MNTPRENLLRTLRRQGFDSVPIDMSLCPSQVDAFKKKFGHTDYQAWFKISHRAVGMPMKRQFQDGCKLYPREEIPANAVIDEWGVAHSAQEGCYHMTHMHHPLAGADVTLAELRNYPLPTVADDALSTLRASIEKFQAQGLAVNGGMACTLWEIGWYLRSMEDLMADMMTDDERAVVLFDRLLDNACRRIETYCRAGADIIILGDDIGMQQTIMMSVDLWSKWLKPRLTTIIAAARSIKPDILIFYHSCGYILPFIPHLIEAGVDILNPIQPECMDFGEVHRLSAGKLSFWGTIGTQTTLPFGTPDEVKAAVRTNRAICGPRGGIVIAPTHLVEPEVPWDNLVALAEAAAEQ